MKFIVLLRNPIDRAYSHYLHAKRDEFEELDFMNALKQESNRLILDSENTNLLYSRFSYVDQGLYFEHFSEYYKCFAPEQFLTILFEDFL